MTILTDQIIYQNIDAKSAFLLTPFMTVMMLTKTLLPKKFKPPAFILSILIYSWHISICTCSQILFQIFSTCQYGEACPRYLSRLLSAPLLSSKGRGRGRSKVGWCPGVNFFHTKVFSFHQIVREPISLCIELFLPSP